MTARASTDPSVSIAGVRRVYRGRRGATDTVALDGVTFDIQPGEWFALLGPNGSGKSTLLRMISTLDVPGEGEVRVLGESVARGAASIRSRLGVLFQHPSVDPVLTIRENLRTSAALYGLVGRQADERVEACADELGLSDRLDDRAGELSGGLLRRADLARALLNDPDVLVLDEPTTGLDPAARRSFMDAINSRRASRGMTIVMSTHLLDEAEHADRLALLANGRVASIGSPSELRGALGAPLLVATTPAHASLLGEGVQLERGRAVLRTDEAGARALATQLLEAGAPVDVGPPTLEDVYAFHTGASLVGEEGA